ncbi:MAG: hypothetical protein K2Y22_01005 [Candidatus Obscuribacterales bacterium]|nr:hypothetical protein [Candidatus Obscuribacterales bacterium]
MGESAHFRDQQKPTSREDGLSEAAWADNSTVKAMAQALSEPFNSFVARPAELIAEKVSGNKTDLHWHVEKNESELFSRQWLTDNIASGITMAGLYSLSDRLAAKPLRLISCGAGSVAQLLKARPLACQITTGLEKVLISKQASLIAGAGAYDGLRETREGETRQGNFAGTAAGFTVFEAGNYFCKLGPGSLANIASYGLRRALIGGAGGAVQSYTSGQFAGRELSNKELATAALIGGTINSALGLPSVSRALKNNLKVKEPANLDSVGLEAERAKDCMADSSKSLDSSILKKRIEIVGSEEVGVHVGRPEKGPFKNYGDFLLRGVGSKYTPMNVYEVAGHKDVHVLVAETDLIALDNAKQLPTMEQMVKILDQSPDSGLVKRIILVNSEAPDSVWFTQNKLLKPNERIYGEHRFNSKLNDYEMRLFKPQTQEEMLKTYLHEYVHVAEKKYKDIFSMTKLANEIEGNCGFQHHGCTHPHEYSASVLLGDNLLGAHPLVATDAIGKAPIQAVTALECLSKILPKSESTYTSQARTLIQSANQNLKAVVLDKLYDMNTEGKSDAVKKLIDFLEN